MQLPPSLQMGLGHVRGTMEGSLMAPHISASWQLPTASAAGTANLSRETTEVV